MHLLYDAWMFSHVIDTFVSNSDVIVLSEIDMLTDYSKKAGRIFWRQFSVVAFFCQPVINRFHIFLHHFVP